MRLDVTCSTDDKYLQHCAAMLCSLFENNKKHDITVHLLHHGLNDDSKHFLIQLAARYDNKISFYDVDISKYVKVYINKDHPNLTESAYYRLLLPSLLDKKIDKVLYLDCDIIVLRDLSSLFCLDLDGYGVAAVEDILPASDEHRSLLGMDIRQTGFCSGMMMINLSFWRENDSQSRMLSFIKEKGDKLKMEDQDVLNHEFRRHWYKLPYKYMRTPMSIAPLDRQQRDGDIYEYVFAPVIIHYAAHVKPWLDISIPDGKYYWKYVRLSGFPNPKKDRTMDRYRKPIRMVKLRYYVNFYIRPFIPDFIELLLRDIYNFFTIFLVFYKPYGMKGYRLKRWLEKYGMK